MATMNVRLSCLTTLTVTSLICFTNLHSSSPCRADEPLVIGAMYNLSGFQAGLDVPSSQGARLAVEQFNRDGGLKGRKVRLVIEDGQSKPEVLRAKTSALFDRFPDTVALMGLSDTDMVLACAPIAAEHGRVFLTSGATSPRLPAQVPKYLFLACFGDNVQAAAAAEWAYGKRSLRSAVVVFDKSHSYTRRLQGYFQARFKQLGGRVLAVRRVAPDNFEDALENLPQADVVFLALEAPDDITKAISLLRDGGVSVPIVGGDSFDAEGLWKSHPEITDVVYTTHAYLGNDSREPQVVSFCKAYRQAYPESTPDAFAALGYDAARLLLALTRAEQPDANGVLEALADVRQFDGVTGTLSYHPGSRIPSKSVSLIEVDKGRLKLVQQASPEEVPAP